MIHPLCLGRFGFDDNLVQDAEFDLATRTQYLTAYNLTVGGSELRMVNLTNGSSTVIGTVEDNCEVDGPIIFPSGPIVGIDNGLNTDTLQVYPKSVTVMLNLISGPVVQQIFIYDLSGCEILHASTGNNFSFPITALSTGTYLTRYTTKDGTFTTRFEKQ